VNRQWEQIKRAEREEAEAETGSPIAKSALDGISKSMPALAASQEMQERAANLGYDWPDIVGVVDKIHEELAELEAAASDEDRREEMGDLLLVMVNLARRNGVDAEAALRAASEKFRGRFRRVERMARERNVQLRDLALPELDALWDAAKAEDRAARNERPTAGQEIAP
jgi:MazG family protein